MNRLFGAIVIFLTMETRKRALKKSRIHAIYTMNRSVKRIVQQREKATHSREKDRNRLLYAANLFVNVTVSKCTRTHPRYKLHLSNNICDAIRLSHT